MPDYNAIRLYHRVETVYSDSETHRRLQEVANVPYPNDPRCKALGRAVNRKSNGMNDTEQAALAVFPEQGIDLGYVAQRPDLRAGRMQLAAEAARRASEPCSAGPAGHLRRHP